MSETQVMTRAPDYPSISSRGKPTFLVQTTLQLPAEVLLNSHSQINQLLIDLLISLYSLTDSSLCSHREREELYIYTNISKIYSLRYNIIPD